MDTGRPVLVFGSHSHEDHYNPAVFEKLKEQKEVRAILSKDIFKTRVPEGIFCRFVKAREKFSPLDGVTAETFHSMDRVLNQVMPSKKKPLF